MNTTENTNVPDYRVDASGAITVTEAGLAVDRAYREAERAFDTLQHCWAGACLTGLFVRHPWLHSLRATLSASAEYDDQGGTYRSISNAVTQVVPVAGATLPDSVIDEAHLTDGTGTFDIGCFQLNIRYHGKYFSTFEEMFDPESNAVHAARFLTELYQEKGTWAEAVAAYHSRTPDLGAAYLHRVKSVLESPGAANLPEPAPIVHENTFPLLQAGGQGSFGSVVPLTNARGPLIGGNS